MIIFAKFIYLSYSSWECLTRNTYYNDSFNCTVPNLKPNNLFAFAMSMFCVSFSSIDRNIQCVEKIHCFYTCFVWVCYQLHILQYKHGIHHHTLAHHDVYKWIFKQWQVCFVCYSTDSMHLNKGTIDFHSFWIEFLKINLTDFYWYRYKPKFSDPILQSPPYRMTQYWQKVLTVVCLLLFRSRFFLVYVSINFAWRIYWY